MTLQLVKDPVLEKIQKHFEHLGIQSSVSNEKLDFESGYVDSYMMEGKNGICTVGSLKLYNSSIDYLHLVKKQEYAKCDFAVGGHVGMGVHLHSWWKMRFFLSFPISLNLGPFDMGTITTIKKGRLHSEVENFVWSGYPKLTTLPPGLVRDNVAEALDSNEALQKLMIKNLLKERTILVSRFSPSQSGLNTKKTGSIVKIESQWKLQKDLFLDKDVLSMYEMLASTVKTVVNSLKYHLE